MDDEGSAHATGATYSPDFPVTPGAYQSEYGGGKGCGSPSGACADAFATKISAQ